MVCAGGMHKHSQAVRLMFMWRSCPRYIIHGLPCWRQQYTAELLLTQVRGRYSLQGVAQDCGQEALSCQCNEPHPATTREEQQLPLIHSLLPREAKPGCCSARDSSTYSCWSVQSSPLRLM